MISKNNNDAWILQGGYAMQARVRNDINIQGKTGTKSLWTSSSGTTEFFFSGRDGWLFWDFVGLVNNTKSKEESKSQKIRLRGMYDTIVDFF